MKTIKILNNSIYSIKFSLSYKNNNESLNSNYILSMNSGILAIPDNAENIVVTIFLINNSTTLIKANSIKLAKAIDKYYEFIGSETNSTLIELTNYKLTENTNKLSFLNKTTSYIVKVNFQCQLYINSSLFTCKEEVILNKSFQYISFPIPINKVSSLDLIILIAKKNSSSSLNFKEIKHFNFTKNKLKLCYELSMKNKILGVYENNWCY